MENEIINTAHRQGHFGIKSTIDSRFIEEGLNYREVLCKVHSWRG